MNRRHATLAAAALTLAATLSACGDDSGSDQSGGTTAAPSASESAGMSMPADVNEQDSSFASDMIVHHRQAIEMAELASSRAGSRDVKELAAGIEAAQSPEIETLSGWLTSWGMKPPGEMQGMDHGSMPGMMSQAELGEMSGMKGADFDKMFLTMMIEHLQGALTMAKAERSSGKNADVKAFADKVVEDQTAEIAKMRGMLE